MKSNSIGQVFSRIGNAMHVLLLIVPALLWCGWCLWCVSTFFTQGLLRLGASR